MTISVTEPIGEAIEWTKNVLFQPFTLKKWLVLGFCSFLASLGAPSGCGANTNFYRDTQPGNRGAEMLQRGWEWFSNETVTAVILTATILLFALSIILVLQWLSSRGMFMFLDGVLRNKGAVKEPWKEFKNDGNSLFLFRVSLLLIGAAGTLIIVAAGALIAWPDISAGVFQNRAWMAIIMGAVLLIPFGILLGLVRTVLGDFAVPVIYRHQIPAPQAMYMVWDELIRPHFSHFILFYVMKWVLGMAAAILAIALTCMTCCLATLPYLGSVILLPIAVFFRSYSVFFLAQFGDKWQVVPLEAEDS